MIWNLINFIFKLSGRIYFSEEKKDWLSALQSSKTYQDEIIFNKIKKIYNGIIDKNSEFYERDGLVFKNKPDEKDLIKFLSDKIEIENNLEILDYGGSLGSRFFSNYNFIVNNKIKWSIVEQENFVKYGKKFLGNNILFFYSSLEQCFSEKK